MKMTEELPSDRVYAYALCKTLSRVPAPATVGLYSSCHSRIHMVLRSIESQMTKEAQENEHQNHRQSVADLFKVIFRLLFYQPVDRLDTKGNQRPKAVQYIFVRFSAWHFAGSDMLWAALVLRLYEAFHENFGKFLLSLYRVTQYTTPMTRIVSRCGTSRWRSKKCCCIPLWLFTLFVLLGILVGFPLILCFSKEHMDAQDSNTELYTIQSILIGIIGLPATYVISSVFLIVKNIFYNQYVNIKKMMDNENVSSQLGFMNEVKKEMEILSCFISFMETFEKKKIRVVLEITHLDRCNPRRIVGVLDAINILLSDEGSPFISMLAVNPEVLTEQLNYAESCFSKEDRAHSFLNRLVTLAFTIPELCDSSKRNIIKRISSGHLELPDDVEDKPLSSSFEKYSEECHIILTERKDPEINLNEKDTENLENLIESVFQCIRDKCIIRKYIMGDTMSIRRVITSVRMSIIIMKTLGHDLPSAEKMAAWVVLANHWPCRLSWIFQCMEDDKQNAEINQQSFDTSKTLWQVFSESRVELYMIRDRVRPLLEQDGDPELFEMFLKVNFTFTINDANRLKLSTVNLDHSIQRQLARIKGMSSLKDTVSPKTPTPLPVKAIINMSMEDICGELKKLELPDRYVALVRENMLDGRALVYSDNSEIQKMLKMPLGHWTAFAIHFLGVTPPAPSCLTAELPSDRVYAYALCKTLSRVPAPATVGLYSSCHSRIHMVLRSIESQMMKETQESKHRKHRQSVAYLFKVIFRLLFYQPVDRKGYSPKAVRYIFVRFSAWHFAGSDMLWAALVLRLYEAFHENFGKFLLSLYRVTQYRTPMKRIVSRCGTSRWRSKKCCCIPLWLFTLFVLLGILGGFPLIFYFFKVDMDAQDNDIEVHIIESFFIGIIGLPITYVISSVFRIVKNFFYNQYVNIKKMMDNEKVSRQLGFMNEVKKEMEILSCFINFMETFERKKIRVVLEITHLDRCNPRRIVGVLDAINILLSDEGSPFISMLAVNPEVLAEQLNYAESCFSKEDRAHSFLNRLVTLAFTIPELCDSSKRNIIDKISSELPDDVEDECSCFSCVKNSEEHRFLLTKREDPENLKIEIDLKEEYTENLETQIESVFHYICDEYNIRKFITGDTMSIRRVITSVRMSIIIMKTLGHDLPSAEQMAAWVVLVHQWPCRLSWILQCMEDDKQNAEINQQSFDTSKTLWQFFSESRVELYMIRDRVRPLLEQDGDPELFEMFLKVNFTFTIKFAIRMKLSTVNLDHSIQRQLARIRGMSSLKDTVSPKTPTPLPVKAIINMSMEDICGELKKLELPDRYVALVRENMLDGRALVYSDNSEIQKMLKMPLGHWTAFAIHFLGVTPPAPSCLIASEDKASSKSHISMCSESCHIYRN